MKGPKLFVICLLATGALYSCSSGDPGSDAVATSGMSTGASTNAAVGSSGAVSTSGMGGFGATGAAGSSSGSGGSTTTTTGSATTTMDSSSATTGGAGTASAGGTGGGTGTMGSGGTDATGGAAGNGATGTGGAGTSTTGTHVVGETGTETIPGNGCTPPGAYANLFVAVAGHTQQESDAKVEAAYNQLYNPSNNNTVYYDGPGQDESYVLDTGNNDVRSEGMSYGMMTALQLDKQEVFDRLWAWVKNHMANDMDEISWHCSSNGNKLSSGGAPDGEEYMATALIFAHNRWGDTGRFDYASEAKWVLDLTRTKYFNQDYHLVKFVSTSNYTDASYILPAFYQVWACFDVENEEFWNEAVTAAREFFQVATPSNGVLPDFSEFNGQARGSAGSDAKRCVMNIMMDHNFFAADPWQIETYATAYGQTMANGGDNSAAQYSCNALLGFGLPEDSGTTFVNRLWQGNIPTGTYRYYDGTLYMLALLHVSGTFKLYY